MYTKPIRYSLFAGAFVLASLFALVAQTQAQPFGKGKFTFKKPAQFNNFNKFNNKPAQFNNFNKFNIKKPVQFNNVNKFNIKKPVPLNNLNKFNVKKPVPLNNLNKFNIKKPVPFKGIKKFPIKKPVFLGKGKLNVGVIKPFVSVVPPKHKMCRVQLIHPHHHVGCHIPQYGYAIIVPELNYMQAYLTPEGAVVQTHGRLGSILFQPGDFIYAIGGYSVANGDFGGAINAGIISGNRTVIVRDRNTGMLMMLYY